MDDFTVTDNRIVAALSELKLINRFLGGNAVSKKGIDRLLEKCGNTSGISILDAGIGGADNLSGFQRGKEKVKIYGIDLNKGICKILKYRSPGINIIFGNMLKPPFRDEAFDIIHFSLVLHHFREEEIVRLISDYFHIIKLGMVINDLHRSYPAYLGIKILTMLFSRSEMVKNDAPLSVKRGFKKKELIKIFKDAGIRKYTIKWNWAFRWMVVILK